MASTPVRSTVRPIESWAYQLQNVDPAVIHKCEADVVVIDPYDARQVLWSTHNVAQMQVTASGKRRRVLAYVSIGEAEDYRNYWPHVKDADYIDRENPEWKGNFKVKFWDADWQAVMFGVIADIMNRGYDGVYLDIIDAYEYYEKAFPDAEYEMADFVISISERIKGPWPKAWVVPQNGEGLLVYREYRNAIDAIGKEDIYYGAEENGKKNAFSYTRDVISYLEALRDSGKPVLAVEYDLNPTQASDVKKAIRLDIYRGVPLVAGRELDKAPSGS